MSDTTTYDRNAQHTHILETENHVTAMVTTVTDHRFIVVRRPSYVVLINDKDGKTIQGDRMVMEDNKIFILAGGTRMMYTEDIKRVYIMTN